MKKIFGSMVVVCAAWSWVAAQAPAAAITPAAGVVTNAPAAEILSAATPEWTGFVRVLRDNKGDVQAVRLVVGEKLVAVEVNEKARELAATPKTRKVCVNGSIERRDGRDWLIVSAFKDAPESLPPAPVPEPVAVTPAPLAGATNAASTTGATNAPATSPTP